MPEEKKDFFEFYQLNLPDAEGTATEGTEGALIKKEPPKTKLFFIGILAFLSVLAGLSWLGAYLFGSGGFGSQEPVALSVDGSKNVGAGEEAVYTITIQNKRSESLGAVSLVGGYPAGFDFSSASLEPKNSNKNFWEIGELKGGGKMTVTLRGTLRGTASSEQKFTFTLYYRQKTASAEYASSASFSTVLSSSSMAIHLDGPTQLSIDEKGTFTISYDSFSSVPEKDRMVIRAQFPKDFILASSTPPFDSDTQWTSQSLLKNINPTTNQGVISFIGSFSNASETRKAMTVQMALSDGREGVFKTESEATLDIALRAGAFNVSASLNGSTGPAPIQMGKPLKYVISYENKGEVALKDVALNAKLESPLLDWSTLADPQTGIVKEHVISWTSKEVSAFKLLKPHEKGTIAFSVALKGIDDFRALPDEVKSLDPFFLESSISGQATLSQEESSQENTLRIEPIVLKNAVNSDADMNARVVYFENETTTVGSGPLPPKVGQPTKYRAHFTVTNTLHELKNLRLHAALPVNVQATTIYDVTAGTLVADNDKHVIDWTLNRLPSQVPSVEIYIDLILTPTKEQLGKEVLLLTGISIDARDSVTGGTLRLLSKDKTTGLSDDPTAQGKGVVEE